MKGSRIVFDHCSFSSCLISFSIMLILFICLCYEQPTAVLKEGLMPTLSVLLEYSSNVRIIRKFLRSRILPPLRDVTHRPEEGGELRNKLCRLMTCTITQVEFLVAEFLFVLCKENGQFLHLHFYNNLFLFVICYR